MTERQIFGDPTPYAFFLNKDGMCQRNPNYKPLLLIRFKWVTLMFFQGINHYVMHNSIKPIFEDSFIPFSEN